jgi:uncharacterized integral membrane protein
MNARLLFKTLFMIVVLILIVLMGMHNTEVIGLKLPPLFKEAIRQPAAIMYISFFGLGLLTGTVLTAGGGGKRGGKPKGD